MKDEDDMTMDDARSRERTTTNIPPFIPAWCIDKGGLSIVPLEIVPQEDCNVRVDSSEDLRSGPQIPQPCYDH